MAYTIKTTSGKPAPIRVSSPLKQTDSHLTKLEENKEFPKEFIEQPIIPGKKEDWIKKDTDKETKDTDKETTDEEKKEEETKEETVSSREEIRKNGINKAASLLAS